MAISKGINGGHQYSNAVSPISIACNFVVDPTNGNGLGVRSIKSNGFVKNVFMHTSATPSGGNPNPAVGYALIQFNSTFNAYLGGFAGVSEPVSGTPILVTTGVTAGNAYVITSVGTTTLAGWQSLGLPIGLTPTVGQSFIAPATATTTGSGVIETTVPSGIVAFEIVGDPNQSISNSSVAQNGGAWVLVKLLGATNSSTTTLIPTAPVAGSVIGMTFDFDQSSVTVDGL